MKKYLNILKYFWLFSFFGNIVILLIVLLYFFSPAYGNQTAIMGQKTAYALQLISVVSALFIERRHKRILSKINSSSDLGEKLSEYKKLYFQSLALLNFVTLLPTVILLLAGEKEFCIIPVAMLLLLFLKRPFFIKLKMDLELKDEDNEKLNNINIVKK
ncbi:MAG: hypothetical protein IJ748_00645 [Bacteroidales bacterium]|nr:hypothetical protein [Bacteroidales bacterium]